jgi:UDP-glucuronate 4-epimerase
MNSPSTPIKTPPSSNNNNILEDLTVTTRTSESEDISSTSSFDASLSSVSSDDEADDDQQHKYENETTVEPHVGYKKVLVTGGAGFIGSHVAEHLLERGDDVVIIDEM